MTFISIRKYVVKESVELNRKYIQYTGRDLKYKVNLRKELKILLLSATSE
jgi:hypothetical protein